MSKQTKFKLVFKFWIEYGGKRVIGEGGAALLDQIKKQGSISKAAENVGMSYRYAWSYLDEVRNIVGEPAVETFRGGRSGGGGARLTEMGEYLLTQYVQNRNSLSEFISGRRIVFSRK